MATEITRIEQGRRGAKGVLISENTHWEPFAARSYECRVLLCQEDGGGFSAHALRLPGVVSEGESIEEALVNITNAFQAAVQSYLENDSRIPWEEAKLERRSGSIERWIVVNV